VGFWSIRTDLSGGGCHYASREGVDPLRSAPCTYIVDTVPAPAPGLSSASSGTGTYRMESTPIHSRNECRERQHVPTSSHISELHHMSSRRPDLGKHFSTSTRSFSKFNSYTPSRSPLRYLHVAGARAKVAATIIGNTTVASAYTLTLSAFALILPQLTASSGLAPASLPSNSWAVFM
jgi:hypothetical protein